MALKCCDVLFSQQEMKKKYSSDVHLNFIPCISQGEEKALELVDCSCLKCKIPKERIFSLQGSELPYSDNSDEVGAAGYHQIASAWAI